MVLLFHSPNQYVMILLSSLTETVRHGIGVPLNKPLRHGIVVPLTERVRHGIGVPLTITSWYWCPTHRTITSWYWCPTHRTITSWYWCPTHRTTEYVMVSFFLAFSALNFDTPLHFSGLLHRQCSSRSLRSPENTLRLTVPI